MNLATAIYEITKLVEAEIARRSNRPGGASTSTASLQTHWVEVLRPALQQLQNPEEG